MTAEREYARIAAEWQPELEVLATEIGCWTTADVEIEARFRAWVDLPVKG